MLVGADRSTTNFANGYISNLRLSNTNRTISSTPTTALTADSNTIFLSLNLNRFQYTDSTAAYTNISVTGTPSVVAFSPFNPTASWSAATYGGSGYFDGSGDYLTVPDNVALRFGTGDFDIEFWYNGIVGPTNSQFVISKFTAGSFPSQMAYVVAVVRNDHPTNPRGISVYLGSTSFLVGSGNIQDNTWYHIAVTRESGSVKVFINGTQVGTTQTITNDITNTSTLFIGASNDASSLVTGYVSNVRIVKGSAVYTSNFTPPTAPLTAITNTSLLLNFTNAGIYDATSKNDLETVGSAQISTTTSQFGGSSIYFNGTNSWLIAPFNTVNDIGGTAPFTIEFWSYFNSLAAIATVVGKTNNATASGSQFEFTVQTNGQISVTFYYSNSAFTVTSAVGAITTGSWQYVAMTKDSSGNYKIFINGTQSGTTVTNTSTLNTPTLATTIGAQITTGNRLCNAYFQDFRITRGVARTITASPTAAFPTL
jgi:hypothetical protein